MHKMLAMKGKEEAVQTMLLHGQVLSGDGLNKTK